MAYTTLTNGNLADADEVMENFNSLKISTIYDGSDFDSTQSGSGSDANSHEIAVTAANLYGADYLIVEVTGQSSVSGSSTTNNDSSVALKLETKETGGSYSTAYDKTLSARPTTSVSTPNPNDYGTIKYVHSLSPGEKSNGITIQLTSTSTANTNSNASFTNDQVVLTLQV